MLVMAAQVLRIGTYTLMGYFALVSNKYLNAILLRGLVMGV